MKILARMLVVLLALGLGFACSHKENKSSRWSLPMRGMAESYEKLIPYMFDSKRYSDPKNEKFISVYLKNINSNASELNKHTGKGISGDDPLFEIGLKGLRSMIQKATESYYVGSYEYSQNLLQASVGYCNSCHTRTSIGPTFIKWDQFEDITSKLPPMDHAQLLIATRQFPKAVDVLEQGLMTLHNDWPTKNKMITLALTVTLKNLGSPERALEVLSAIPKSQMDSKMQKNFKAWASYLNQWKDGKLKNQSSHRQIIKSKKPYGRHLVETLHNSLILHQGLSTETSQQNRAMIYHQLGQIYSKYPGLGTWNLPETYFETCIYEWPGTKIALKCYYDLESQIAKSSLRKTSPWMEFETANLKKLKVLATKKRGSMKSSSSGSGSDDI
jgi:hypothetical protein